MPIPIPALADLPLLELPPVQARARFAALSGPGFVPPGRRCARDGVPVDRHPCCAACGILAGAMHPLAAVLYRGLCAECARRGAFAA